MSEVAYATATKVLKKHREKLDILAEELMVKETLDADDFAKLIGPKNALAVAVVKSK